MSATSHALMAPEAFLRLVPLADACDVPMDRASEADPVAAVARHARQTPQRLALTGPAGTLTFAGLDRLGAVLAVRLDALLQGRREPVLALAPLGPVTFAAMLAGLRLGLPVVPLDPHRSPPRNRQVAATARARVVVAASNVPEIVRHVGPGGAVVALDEVTADEGGPAFDRGDADDDALVIFTSGSTGRPKGVVKSRRSFTEALRVRWHVLGYGPDDVFGFAGSSGVSGSHLNCWAALVAGATVVPASGEAGVSPVLELFAHHGVTVSASYVGFGRVMAQHPQARERLATVRAATLFGDVVQWDDLDRLRGVLRPEARLICSFGATEASWSVGWEVPARIEARGRVPIGGVLPGAALWLDPSGDGQVGELVVASPRLSDAYFDDPAATAARFFGHPDGSGRTLFRTGDMVRRREDGLLEFAGRSDNQVKLNGWRIELEEIESAARSAPDVAAACVVPRRDAAGSVEALVLYVSFIAGGNGAEAVAEAIRHGLPRPMWPGEIVVVRALPMTQSAKVDRTRLAEIDRQRRERDAGPSPVPATGPDPLEGRIAACIARELRRGSYDPARSFIACGGDSLQALAAAITLEQQFGVIVDPERFLDDRALGRLVTGIAGEVLSANDALAGPARADSTREKGD